MRSGTSDPCPAPRPPLRTARRGKDTTLRSGWRPKRNALRFSPDEWIEAILADRLDIQERDRLRDPVENLQWDLAQSYLRKGLTVILENGFWAEEERTAYAVVALDLGARIELHFLDVPFDELWRRIVVRNQTLATPSFVMDREEVEAGWTVFQPPTPEELAFYDEGVAWRDSPDSVASEDPCKTIPGPKFQVRVQGGVKPRSLESFDSRDVV